MRRIMKFLGKCHPGNRPTNKECIMATVVIIVLTAIIILCTGCSGSGFDKRATVMPNSIGISFGQEKYKGDSDAWRGGSISATWEFK